MSEDIPDNLELETRRTIYQHILDTPGIHFRALFEELDVAKGTLQYHLHWLADESLLDVRDGEEYTRYFPAGSFDESDRAVLDALRRTIARRILAYLVSEGPLTTTELGDRLEKSPSTISWHLSNLVDAGLVEKERDGREVYYEVSDADRVQYLYTVYRGSFTDRLVDQLFDLFEAY
ncbi:winged helix-turn-helix transcriptional regulator [Salinibaculum rarum]|uniref:winged helix-turn-helix transcriptional regulator n=1 Tax=Salinibaculum rarum TaxID=3058903 RepID=UPI00265F7D6E|nr:metalloregulator ArsR/SmtB family transcription factor [Salinibaculum sp. KK48]